MGSPNEPTLAVALTYQDRVDAYWLLSLAWRERKAAAKRFLEAGLSIKGEAREMAAALRLRHSILMAEVSHGE